MKELTIRIVPPDSDQGLLRAADAMAQVLDWIKLHIAAQDAAGPLETPFEWRLVHASTQSPLTVVVRAESLDPSADVSPDFERVTRLVSTSMTSLIERGDTPRWMKKPATLGIVRSVLERNQNGIGRTEIEGLPTDRLRIDRAQAMAGMRVLSGFDAFGFEGAIAGRIAWGEIQGTLVAAGLYYRRPAIQILTRQYGLVWCPMSDAMRSQFGDTNRIADVWSGRRFGVAGDLHYEKGGELSHIFATDIRLVEGAPPIDLDSVLDPDFTSGLDPVEYLRQLHEGELAG